MLNLQPDKIHKARTGERCRKILSDDRQDDSIAVGGISNRAR